MDKIDAIVVGGGLAGLSAAYRLADAGKQVILLERGDAPGSKNVTGGRIYTGPIRKYLPEIIDSAPFERHVVKEMITVLDEKGGFQFEYGSEKWKSEPYMSYTVLRAKFDSWFADQAAQKGVFIIPKKKVDELLWEDGRVAGIRSGEEEIGAHIVIAADGALSFLAQKAGLRPPHKPENFAVAMKEVYKLDEKTIEDRFRPRAGRRRGGISLWVPSRGACSAAVSSIRTAIPCLLALWSVSMRSVNRAVLSRPRTSWKSSTPGPRCIGGSGEVS